MSDEEAEADMNESQRLIIKTCMDRRESEWNTNSANILLNNNNGFSSQISLPISELRLSCNKSLDC